VCVKIKTYLLLEKAHLTFVLVQANVGSFPDNKKIIEAGIQCSALEKVVNEGEYVFISVKTKSCI
jgi:hypothetical protein